MHPAPSVIIFTTLSGLGFGLLAFLCLGYPSIGGLVSFIFFAIGFGLAIGGLLSSTFHLGHPERAWRSFSQWRSSWLSREGLAAIFTFAPLILFYIFWYLENNFFIFFHPPPPHPHKVSPK